MAAAAPDPGSPHASRVALVACLVALVVAGGPAWAETPREVCARLGTDDTIRPIPDSLVAEVTRAFGLEAMPVAQVMRGTVFRCMEGEVLACNLGANLPCGKADTRETLPTAGAAWCREHPSADFVPAYISGHDTIYRWRCVDGAPVAGRPVAAIDARGFLARYWKRLY